MTNTEQARIQAVGRDDGVPTVCFGLWVSGFFRHWVFRHLPFYCTGPRNRTMGPSKIARLASLAGRVLWDSAGQGRPAPAIVYECIHAGSSVPNAGRRSIPSGCSTASGITRTAYGPRLPTRTVRQECGPGACLRTPVERRRPRPKSWRPNGLRAERSEEAFCGPPAGKCRSRHTRSEQRSPRGFSDRLLAR